MATKAKKLNPRHEVFCQLYAGYGDRSCLNNGVLSYIQAYEIDTPMGRQLKKWKKGQPAYWDYTPQYKSAKTDAHRLLTNADIKARIYSLFKLLFNPDVVDSELLAVIMQNDDPKAKVQGIREFNELKGRITKKIKLSGAIKSNLSADKLTKIAEFVVKRAKQKVK